jgi:hypothetical protein
VPPPPSLAAAAVERFDRLRYAVAATTAAIRVIGHRLIAVGEQLGLRGAAHDDLAPRPGGGSLRNL